MSIFQGLIVALSMYSKIPMPQIEWNEKNMRYALCYFPVVGGILGLLCYGWWILSEIFGAGNLFQSAVFVVIPVLVTGGIHMDGLLDTADALSSWQPRERRLEILKDSHAGAFAIIVCVTYGIAQLGIWSEVTREDLSIVCMGFVFSRILSAFGICTFSCAKGTGLAATFSRGADRVRCRIVLVLEGILCCAGMLWQDVQRGALAIAAGVCVCLICHRMAMKKFGGITGDIQGFFLQMCELVILYTVVLGGKI